MTVILAHWSSHPVTLDNRIYEQESGMKPRGFWFDCDKDWKHWCEGQQFNLQGLRYRHRVTILDATKLLILSTATHLDSFTAKYGVSILHHSTQLTYSINWREVANGYDGIVISPYQYPRRSDFLWYYGWDCASGCVWNTQIIQLRPVQDRKERSND